MSNVVVLKMSNGDEVIGNISNSDSDNLYMDKPRVVFHNGEQGGLMPYCISSPDVKEFPINKNLVVGRFTAPKELADGYLQSTTSILLG